MSKRACSRTQPSPAPRAIPRRGAAALLALLMFAVAAWRLLAPAQAELAAPAVTAEAAPPPAPPASARAGVAVPAGMVYVPGGTVEVGSTEGNADEEPVFRARVAPFLMDRSPVTVAQFRAFVRETGYRTQAEQFGDAGILDARTGQWRMAAGATWQHPFGPEEPAAADDHPVTQVSWNDAVAYARWAGKRLPTEVEWEHAARGARNRRSRYAWGDELTDHQGRHRANTYQGPFPLHDAGEDGYLRTSPVGAFGATELGLTDMGGNVWEWSADWYRPYAERAQPFKPSPESEKAQRGGSYLCNTGWCHGYRVSARSHSTPETALAHVGFRTVQDLPAR